MCLKFLFKNTKRVCHSKVQGEGVSHFRAHRKQPHQISCGTLLKFLKESQCKIWFLVGTYTKTTNLKIHNLINGLCNLSVKKIMIRSASTTSWLFVSLNELVLLKPHAMQMQMQKKCTQNTCHTLKGHLFLCHDRCGHWLWWLIQNAGFDTSRI